MDIIRIKLPEPKRFAPFKVADYRDLLIIRNEIKANEEDEQQIFNELLEDLYPEYNVLLREFIFINVLLSSLGKSTVEVEFVCPVCKAKKKALLHLQQKPLAKPTITIDNITITFNYPDKKYSPVDMFLNTIDTVSDGESVFKWVDLSDEDKDAVIELVTFKDLESIIDKLGMIHTFQKITCCKTHDVKYTDALSIFKLVINPDDIFLFYRINHALVKSDYSIRDIMSMLPVERTIALSLVEKDLKQCNKDKGSQI